MSELSSDSIKSIFIILLIALISPFIINCFFAYPQTDDFMCSSIARDMGFFKSQHHWFMTWSGRFTSIALISINPLVHNSIAGYKLFLVCCMLVLFFSVFTFIHAITSSVLSCRENLIITLTLLFAFFDQMDDVKSGLYWMSGVIPYQVAGALLLLFFALLLFINQNKKFDNVPSKCVALIIAILLGGTNEIVLVLVLLITSVSSFEDYIRNKKVRIFPAATIIAVASGSFIGLLAPGNFTRLSMYHERKSVVYVAWNSFYSTLTAAGVWITSPLTLILMCMVLTVIIRKPQLREVFGAFRVLTSLCSLLFLTFICFFIPYWSTGKPPENRVLNMIYFLFMIGWMINTAIIFAHCGDYLFSLLKKVPVKTGCVIAAIYMVILFSLGTSNFMLVTKDLLSGDSSHYNAEMRQREIQIINSDCENCMLDDITVTPGSLYFYFLGPNSDYWVNGYYASYFGKKSVTLITHKTKYN